jgi:hypothetical protein
VLTKIENSQLLELIVTDSPEETIKNKSIELCSSLADVMHGAPQQFH